jgi:hypothetical protein
MGIIGTGPDIAIYFLRFFAFPPFPLSRMPQGSLSNLTADFTNFTGYSESPSVPIREIRGSNSFGIKLQQHPKPKLFIWQHRSASLLIAERRAVGFLTPCPPMPEQFIHGKLTFRAASETFNADILLRENRDESIRTIHRKDF